MSAKPLHLLHSPPSPSFAEKTCRMVPLVGWVIGNELEKQRNNAALEYLAQQLTIRSTQQTDANGRDDTRTRVAAFVALTVKDTFGWPNDHFIEDDPFDLMLFGDEGAGIEVINAVEDYFALPRGTISNEQIEESSQMTFGQFVDFVISIAEQKPDSKQ